MSKSDNHHLGHDGSPIPDAFYVRTDDNHYVSTLHSQGVWQPGEQHMAPASALLISAIENRLPADKQIARMSFDILGVIHSGAFTVEVEVTRPGRTIELVEARMRHGSRVSIHARVWRLAAHESDSIAGLEWPQLPPPDSMPAMAFPLGWDCGFLLTLTGRQQADVRPGRGRSWLRTDYPLVEGEADPATASFMKVVDTANGMAPRKDPSEAFFANVDLSIHLVRQPEPGWVGMDTRASFGPTGLGETFTVLSDIHGPVGTAAQALTVRPRD